MTYSQHIKIPALIIGLLLCLLSGCDGYDARKTRQHQATAKALMPLVQAIEAYKTDHGEYPETLEKIIPDYLESEPQLPDVADGLWYKRRDYYYKSEFFDSIMPREYYLAVGINSEAMLQRDEELGYYPTRWRTSDNLDPRPTPESGSYRNPIALDDNWVRYRD